MDIGGSIPNVPWWLWASLVSAIIVLPFKGRLAALATGILAGLVLTRGLDFINLVTISSVKAFVYWMAYTIVFLIGGLSLLAILILLAMSGGGGSGGSAGDGGTTRR